MSSETDTRQSFVAQTMLERVSALSAERPGAFSKGLPPGFAGRYSDIGSAGFALANETLPMPVALLNGKVMQANSNWMRRFLDLSGLSIAPHGKTVMSPEIFHMQMQDGAWGMTVATVQQAVFCVHLGIRRILYANQLIGKENIRIILDLLDQHPDLIFYCLVDSIEGVDQLAAAAEARGTRRLNLLLEAGLSGGRTGLRDIDSAMHVARRIAAATPWLTLAGIEAFEGVVSADSQQERERIVTGLMHLMREIATCCEREKLFDVDEILLTAGGSEFFDMVASGLSAWDVDRPRRVVIRSGCYIVHDSIAYEQAYARLAGRSETARAVGHPLQAALEVWAVLQSRPEPDLAFATLGKRDVSHDWHMPSPLKWFRPGAMSKPESLPEGHRVVRLHDQHAQLEIPADSPLRVGDLLGFGISHVCTTFDKWRCILVVDDDYQVTGAVRTFF